MKLFSKLTALLLCALFLVPAIAFADNSQLSGNLTDGHIFEDLPHLSNEKFFGEWDAENEKWVQEPLIDYDFSEYNQPMLEEVRNSVKGRDYEGAKEKIFEYYKYLKKYYSSAYSGSDSKDNINQCILVENNMVYDYMTMTLVDIAEVGAEWGFVSVDLTSQVSSVRSTGISLDILALNKDGCMAEFYSRENSENAPYVEVIMNGGIKKVYYADADLYKMAGTAKTENHGLEDRLYCEESESSIGLKTSPVDENTKRIKIRFAFPDITAGDVIESATLYMYGRNTGGLDSKKIVLFKNSNMTWKEDTYVWSNESLYYYSNDKEDHMNWDTFSDASYRLNEDRFRWLMERYCAQAYVATGNENYAYHSLRTYMSFIYDKGDRPLYNKTLDAATRLSQAPGTLRQLYDSIHMTPTIFTNHLKNMWLMCDAFSKRKASSGNWGTVEMAALYGAAFYFKEFKADPVVGMSFSEYAVSELEENVLAYALEDGSTSELPIHYTCYALDGAIQPRGVVVSNGGQETYTKSLKDTIRSMARYAVDMSAPGFIGNGHADDSFSSHHNLYKNIGNWLGDQVLINAGTNGQGGSAPDYTSVIYPTGSRQGVMRTGWGESDLYLHFNVDGAVGNHGHADDLALIIFGFGDTLLCDPLYITDSNAMGDWMYSAEAHNTVTLNKNDQWKKQAKGNFERWETNDGYDYVHMSTPNIDGAEASRKVLFVKPGYFIVTDYIIPDNMSEENHYDQLWHFNSDANLKFDESTKTVKSNRDGGNLTVVPVDPDSIIYDKTVDYKTIDPLKAKEYDTILKRGYVKEESGISEAEYVAYGRKITGSASFSTVLYPTALSRNVTVTTSPLKTKLSSADAQAFTIFVNDNVTNKANTATYYTLNNMMKKDNYEIGKYTTDATLMYVENDYSDNLKQFIIQDATQIKNSDGSYILKTADGYSPKELSVMIDGQNVYITSSKDVNLEKLTFTADKNTKNVYLNDESVSFKTSGNYVYFGETPIVEGEEEKEETVTPAPSTPNPSGGHGTGGGGGGGSSRPASGGSSGGSSGGGSYIPPVDVTPEKETNEFYKKELENHWGKNEIEKLIEDEIIKGDGVSLNLSSKVSRAEFAELVVRATKLPGKAYEGIFEDVSKDDWFANSLQTLYEKGIISGDGKNFNPNGSITREEMAKILVNTMEYLWENIDRNEEILLNDLENASEWAVSYIEKAAKAGIIKGDNNGNFNPKNNAMRDEAMITIYRLMNFKEDAV